MKIQNNNKKRLTPKLKLISHMNIQPNNVLKKYYFIND